MSLSYNLPLRSVNFDRNYLGAAAPIEGAYTPGYDGKMRATRKAVRWRMGDKGKVVYFPHQY